MSEWELYQPKESGNSFQKSNKSVSKKLESEWELYQPKEDDNSYKNIPFAKNISQFLMNHPTVSSFLQKYEQPVQKFNETVEASRLPAIGGGVLQGGADTLLSIANLPLEMAGIEKVSHPHLDQYLPNDIFTKGAFLGGELLGGYGPAKKFYDLIGKAIPEMTGKSRLLGKTLQGAATGFGIGEEMPYGRNAGLALGGVGSFANQLRPTKVAENIFENKKSIENQYAKGYENLFSSAEKEGLGNIEKPKGKLDYFFDNAANKFQKSIKKYFEEPLIRNAHNAQSDLGKFIRKFEDSNLTSPMRKAVNQAKSFQKALRDKMHESLESKPGLKLSNKYQDLTKGYLKDVIPYKDIPGIEKYSKGKLTNLDLISKLLNTEKGKEFLIKEGSKYPALGLQKITQNPLISKLMEGAGMGLGLGGAGLGGYGAYDYYNHQNQNP